MLSVTTSPFGTTSEGQAVTHYTLKNSHGLSATVTDFGALLTSVTTPDREGKLADITLGYDDLAGWEKNEPYFGATVGRYGNRIAGGKFDLDGKTYTLATNNDPAGVPCALHGGLKGFNKVCWSAETVEKDGAVGVQLRYLSKDGEEGYPGNVTTKVTYWLSEKNELHWEVEATSDAATPINIVQHTYWNLSGDGSQSILDHEVTIPAETYLAAGADMIPTGDASPVAGTALDFRESTTLGARISADSLSDACGYDHCYVIGGEGLRQAGLLTHPASGRSLEILTDQPGVQLYTGNFLKGADGKNGIVHENRTGVCLETQNFPDAPNKPTFPNSILRPGETYRHTMVMKFSW